MDLVVVGGGHVLLREPVPDRLVRLTAVHSQAILERQLGERRGGVPDPASRRLRVDLGVPVVLEAGLVRPDHVRHRVAHAELLAVRVQTVLLPCDVAEDAAEDILLLDVGRDRDRRPLRQQRAQVVPRLRRPRLLRVAVHLGRVDVEKPDGLRAGDGRVELERVSVVDVLDLAVGVGRAGERRRCRHERDEAEQRALRAQSPEEPSHANPPHSGEADPAGATRMAATSMAAHFVTLAPYPALDREMLVLRPVVPSSFWVASTKPGAALARRQGWAPWQGRGWTLAPRDRGQEAGMHCWMGH